MIGRKGALVFVSALALTACGGSGPGDTVEDFIRAGQRLDIARMDDLLRGEARDLVFAEFYEGLETESPVNIDIISEEVYDGQPDSAKVVAIYGDPRISAIRVRGDTKDTTWAWSAHEYGLLRHDGEYKIAYKIAAFLNNLSESDLAGYREGLSGEDGVAQGTSTEPGRTVVDYIRAREQGADPGRLADLVYIPGEELIDLTADLVAFDRLYNTSELEEAEEEELRKRGRSLAEREERVVGPNSSWLNMAVDVFGDNIFEMGESFFSYTILSEDVYQESTVRARVEVEAIDSFEDGAAYTFGLVMEDGRWRITAITVDYD